MEPITSSGSLEAGPVFLYVPTDTWSEVVRYYSIALNQQPNPSAPPEAVFRLLDGSELHVVATNEREKIVLSPANFFLNLPSAEFVRAAYQAALQLGAIPIIQLQTVDIYPVFRRSTNSWVHMNIMLASVKFPSKLALAEDQIYGLSHNPNW